MREFYVRELVEAGKVTVEHVSSSDNFADLLTKPHNTVVFSRLLKLINFGPIAELHGANHTADALAVGRVPREPMSKQQDQ